MKHSSNIKAQTSTVAIISPAKFFLLSRAITFYLREIPSSFLHMQQPHPSTMFSQSFKLNQVRQQKLFWMHFGSKFKAKIFMFLTWTSKLRHLRLDFGIFNYIFGFLMITCTNFYDVYTSTCQVINCLSITVDFEIMNI